jgi:hypothetical protein
MKVTPTIGFRHCSCGRERQSKSSERTAPTSFFVVDTACSCFAREYEHEQPKTAARKSQLSPTTGSDSLPEPRPISIFHQPPRTRTPPVVITPVYIPVPHPIERLNPSPRVQCEIAIACVTPFGPARPQSISKQESPPPSNISLPPRRRKHNRLASAANCGYGKYETRERADDADAD